MTEEAKEALAKLLFEISKFEMAEQCKVTSVSFDSDHSIRLTVAAGLSSCPSCTTCMEMSNPTGKIPSSSKWVTVHCPNPSCLFESIDRKVVNPNYEDGEDL